jgi:cell division protein FtsW
MLSWSVIALLGVAVVMVNSASMSLGNDPVSLKALLLGRPTIYAALAIAAMWFTSHLDLRRIYAARGLANPILWLLLVALGLCAAALVPALSAEINGSRRWLFLGPRGWGLTFQPSELAKWALVAALAWWCARHPGAIRRFWSGLLPALLLTGLVCGLIVTQDLGTAALIGAVAVMVLLAGGAKWWHLACMLPVAAGGLVAMIFTSPYRVKRLLAFADPFADPQGIGYHPIQSMVAFAHGGAPWGLGAGPQNLGGYLPADTTDFLFAVICEELGLPGAALVMGLYLLLLWTAFSILRDCRHTFGRLLGFAIVLTVGLQAVMNIAVVTVVVPTKGIALPLLSSGGTGWVMCAACVGLLAALDRINRIEAEEGLGPAEMPVKPPTPATAPLPPVVSVSASAASA